MSCVTQSQSSAKHQLSNDTSFNAFVRLNIDIFSRFECIKGIEFCRGFLIDGDLAINWRKPIVAESISVCDCLASSNSRTYVMLRARCPLCPRVF